METSPRTVLTVAEVAVILGQPKRSIQRDVMNKRIPAQKLPGGTGLYLIDRSVVDELLEARRAAAALAS